MTNGLLNQLVVQADDRVSVRILGRADWYADGFQTRSATRFPRYEFVTVEPDAVAPRHGSIASFNHDDDEIFREALSVGDPIDVDRFRIHWLSAIAD